MTFSPPTKDNCFHEESSVNWIHSINLIWLSDYQLFRYVEHLFHCEISSCILDGMKIFWVILSHEHKRTQCRRHKNSFFNKMFVAVLCCIFEDWSFIFRTRSFTLCKNVLDFNDMSDSATVSESISSSSTINLSVCCVKNRVVVH